MSENMRKKILVVTGSTLRAEECDRPLAYRVKGRIDELSGGDTRKHAIVMSTFPTAGRTEDRPSQHFLYIPSTSGEAHRISPPLSLAVEVLQNISVGPLSISKPRCRSIG